MNVKVAVAVILVVIVAAGAALFILGGGGKTAPAPGVATTTTKPPTAGLEQVATLKIGVVADQLVTDPAAAYNMPSLFIVSLTADTLVKADPVTGRLTPGLAVKWSTPDNGVTWYFTIREGLQFPDGSKLDANAVARSFQRLLAVRGDYSRLASAIIVGVEAVNETTVKFTLKESVPGFPQLLASPIFAVSSPSLPLFKADPQTDKPGLGPYVVKAASPTQVVLEKNPDYYMRVSGPDRIIVQAYTTSKDLLQAAENGEVQVAWWGLSSDDAKTLERKGFKLETSDPLILKLLAIKTTGGPLADPQLRLAIAKAISQEDMAGILPGEFDQPAYSIIPSPLLGYQDVFRSISGDLAGAKEILREKGYTPDNPLELKLVISPGLNGEIDKSIADIVKNQLEATGLIHVVIQEVFPAAFYKTLQKGDFDIAIVTVVPVYPDPTYYVIQTMYSRVNKLFGTGYSNPQVDSLIENALSTVDYTVRENTFKTIQKNFLAKDIPYVPLVELKASIASSPDLPAPIKLSSMLTPIVSG